MKFNKILSFRATKMA